MVVIATVLTYIAWPAHDSPRGLSIASAAPYGQSSKKDDSKKDDSKKKKSSKDKKSTRKLSTPVDVGFDTVHAKGRGTPRFVNGKIEIEESSDLYKGRILDITTKSIYMDSWRGKHEIPRSIVTKIDRLADESAIGVFEKFGKKAKTKKSWAKLLDFTKKNGLIPEQRACLRALVKLEPKNEEHRVALGERKLDGKWVDESKVESLLQKGYELSGNELVKSASGSSKTTASKSKKRRKKNPKDIKALDHIKEAVEKRNAHSLWMLLARSAIFHVPGSKDRLNMAACQKFIDQLEVLGDFEFRLRSYLAEEGVPKDWASINLTKAKAFVEKHGEDDSIHLETRYYHVLSTLDPRPTREFGHKMDLVTKQVYQKVFEFEEQIPFKYVVRIYRNASEYQRNGGPMGAGAHYEPNTKVLVGYPKSTRDSFGLDTYKSMFHEGWHQYFDFYIPNAPRWFDEGFAEIVSPVSFKGGKAKMNTFNPGRSQAVKYYQQQGRLVPLDELIRMTHREFYQPNVVGVAYAQAWSFVYFLTNFKHKNAKTQRKVRGFYKDYFWELHRGTDPVKACDIVFKDVKFHTLERAWIDAIPKQK
jgi:hypothetical protein